MDKVFDKIPVELLADISLNPDSKVVKCRCVSCQKDITTTLGELRQKFHRGSYWWTLLKQRKFNIPFTKYELILSFFSSEKATHQPRKFFR